MNWLHRNFPQLSVIVYLLLHSNLADLVGAAAQNGEEDHGDCSREEFIRCFNPLEMITGDTKDIRFVTNKEELDRMCPDLEKGLDCVQEYTSRCMKQEQQDQFNRLYRGTAKVIGDVCQDGPYQREYLRHAPCVQKVRREDENCAAKYQRELKDINPETHGNISSQSESNNNVKRVCCSLQTYLECSEKAVLNKCGPEPAAFTKSFLDTMASSLIQSHCEKYPAGSEECSSSGSWRHAAASFQWFLGLGTTLVLLLLQQNRT